MLAGSIWESLSQIPLGVGQSLDNIFAAVLVGGIDLNTESNIELRKEKANIAKVCRQRFLGDFPFNIFYNSYAIFYEIIVDLQIKSFTVEQLREIIENNKDLILGSPYIDKSKFTMTSSGNLANNDDILNAFTNILIEEFTRLSLIKVDEEEFKASSSIYVGWYKDVLAEYTAQAMTSIMSPVGFDQKTIGGRVVHYSGLDEMVKFYNENMKIIKSLSEESRIRTTVLNARWLDEQIQEEKDNKTDTKALFRIGIREMDATIGELRRGNMLGVMGPPKGGKTRFTNFLVQRALSLGFNVCVWPLEGTKEEWESMQLACLLAQSSYSEVKSGRGEGMLRISSKDILQKKYRASEEIKRQVYAAKSTMAISENYGRLSFIEGTAYLEDFLEVLQSHYESENPFDVVVIDSLVNIMSKKSKGKVERISDAYMLTKDFLANKLKTPALGIMTAQLKQEVVDMLRRDPDAILDVTSGGESAETIRTPDEVIGLFSSKEERDNNIMKIYSVASRHNGSFPDFQARCYLECCYFLSQEDDV